MNAPQQAVIDRLVQAGPGGIAAMAAAARHGRSRHDYPLLQVAQSGPETIR